MSTPSQADARTREQLSALIDGESDAAGAENCCGAWRSDAQARASWHAYHLIGDVLRSEDLTSDPAHDAAFLAALRTRLEREPVVLSPGMAPLAPAPGASGRDTGAGMTRRWMATTAPIISASARPMVAAYPIFW